MADAAGFMASVLAVLEAGGVVLPLNPRRGTAALEREAARARALAVIVGDAADDCLDVVAVDAQPARARCPRRASSSAPAACAARCTGGAGLGVAVDAIARQVGLDASSRLGLVGPLAHPSVLTTALATLRAGGALLDGGGVERGARRRGARRRLPAARRVGRHGELLPFADAASRAWSSSAMVDVASLRAAFPAARIARALDTAEALRVAAAEGDAPLAALPGVTLRADGDAPAEIRRAAILGYLDEPGETRAAFVERDGRRFVRAWPVDRVDPAALERYVAACRACARRPCSPCATSPPSGSTRSSPATPTPCRATRRASSSSTRCRTPPTGPSIVTRSGGWRPSTSARRA